MRVDVVCPDIVGFPKRQENDTFAPRGLPGLFIYGGGMPPLPFENAPGRPVSPKVFVRPPGRSEGITPHQSQVKLTPDVPRRSPITLPHVTVGGGLEICTPLTSTPFAFSIATSPLFRLFAAWSNTVVSG